MSIRSRLAILIRSAWGTMSKNIFDQLISQQFGNVERYSENHTAKTLEFWVRGYEIEYDRLEEIAKITDTKLINFRSVVEYTDSGCTTCGTSSDSYVRVWCEGVRFFDTDPIVVKPEIQQHEDDDAEYNRDDRSY